jgi:ABC-type transport system substrate-binding protein
MRPGASQGSANVYVEPYVSGTLWFTTLDPALAGDVHDIAVLQKIYAGLVKQVYDRATGQFRVVPDLAAALPRVSPDGLVYTFTLRHNERFSDGTPVTAQDVVHSLNRALAPQEASPVAQVYLGAILGAADVAAGRARTCRGVAALGTDTVQITLTKPVRYFLAALSYPTGFVLKSNVPAGARLTTTPSLIVGAGPFMLKGSTWQYRSRMALVPNPFYYAAQRITLKGIDVVLTGSPDAEFTAYRSGQIPMASLPPLQVARYRGSPEYHESPFVAVIYLIMNVAVPPFDNRHLRRAVSFAINRRAIVDGVLHATAQTLDGWYPRGILGYDGTIRSQVPHYDPALARKELALARAELKGALPAIPLTYGADGGGVDPVLQQVQRDLKAVGITITLRPVPRTSFLDPAALRKTACFGWGTSADYLDPQDFSDVVQGVGGFGRYSNPELTALFSRAALEANGAVRERLYRQAQLLLLNDAPIAVLFQPVTQWLISTRYHGLELNPASPVPQPVGNDWANVTVTP